MKHSKKKVIATIFIVGFMILLTFSFLYPLFYMLNNALKTRADYYTNPFGLPAQITLENFRAIIKDYNIGRNILNSLIIAVSATTLAVISSAIASYAFAKMKFTGKKIAYAVILSTMFLPAQITMIPRYAMFAKLGMIDHLWSVILVYWVGGVPGAILLMRSAFMGISNEVIESAKLDGAGFFTTLFRIVMPMGFSGIAIVIIFQFINAWNDYLTPLLYLESQEKKTLMVVLSGMVTKYGDFPTRQFAGLFLSVIPTIVIYLCLQKYMLKGVTTGAIK